MRTAGYNNRMQAAGRQAHPSDSAAAPLQHAFTAGSCSHRADDWGSSSLLGSTVEKHSMWGAAQDAHARSSSLPDPYGFR
jgi:hypothetical protein